MSQPHGQARTTEGPAENPYKRDPDLNGCQEAVWVQSQVEGRAGICVAFLGTALSRFCSTRPRPVADIARRPFVSSSNSTMTRYKMPQNIISPSF